MKQFKQRLELVLEDFYSVKASINPSVQPLLTPHIDAVVRSLLPGWTTLTWSTMNIDAFLHRAQASVKALEVIVSSVNDILQERVYGTLQLIKEMSLFDIGLATSRMWVSRIISYLFIVDNHILSTGVL